MLQVHTAVVPAAWIDYNRHMTEGAYGLAFGDASDAVLLHAGFDAAYRADHGGSFYTVEAHITFRRELREGDRLAFESIVLGADAKRLHLFHRMRHAAAGYVAATQEALLLHVDLDTGRVAAMAPELAATFVALAAEHATIPRPDEAGASIRPVPPESP